MMDTRAKYAGVRKPDGQESNTQRTSPPRKTNTTTADVKPITIPEEDESIYEVHECGTAAGASTITSSKMRVDSIYTNDSVFSPMNRCKQQHDNSLLTPVANSIDNVEMSESEYDYPYTDMTLERPPGVTNYGSATEPRRQKRRRFGSRDRRMRKGSSDGQMYSVLIRPELEAVSYQKSQSDTPDHVDYARKIERSDQESTYEIQRIDSSTDLYSAHPNRVLVGNSWYDKPRGSSTVSNLSVPRPDEAYSDFVRASTESGNRFAAGYLTSIRKAPSIPPSSIRQAPSIPPSVQVTPANPSKVDYQPPEADHYQSYQCNSVIQRNLYRHQFQTVHNRPDKPTTISVNSTKLQRPNCLPITTKYHDYVNGKMISKPPLPRRHAPVLPPTVRSARYRGGASPSAASNGIPSPGSNSSLSPLIPGSNPDFPSPDDLDSDNYLSLRFSERAAPMKPASNI